MDSLARFLSENNMIYKEIDGIYHDAIRKLGLSDSVFWILYTIREAPETLTQSTIVNNNAFPPQTVNSALKKMEKDGLVELRSQNDRRKKYVFLTDAGERLTRRTVDRVVRREIEAGGMLSASEREMFLSLSRKYAAVLRQNFQTLDKENESSWTTKNYS